MKYLNLTYDLQEHIDNAEYDEVFDKYFNTNVLYSISQLGITERGVETLRKFLLELLNNVERFHSSGTKIITSNENMMVSLVHTWWRLVEVGQVEPHRFEVFSKYKWQGDQVFQIEYFYIKSS